MDCEGWLICPSLVCLCQDLLLPGNRPTWEREHENRIVDKDEDENFTLGDDRVGGDLLIY